MYFKDKNLGCNAIFYVAIAAAMISIIIWVLILEKLLQDIPLLFQAM